MVLILPDQGGDGGGGGSGGDGTIVDVTTLSYLFTVPVVYDNPPILPETTGIARKLFRYFPNRPRQVAVFALSDGTYVQDTATPENSNTNIPYPYDPNNPSGPYAISYYVDYQAEPVQQTVLNVSHDVWIVNVYQGDTVVDYSEAANLASAGYGDLITEI